MSDLETQVAPPGTGTRAPTSPEAAGGRQSAAEVLGRHRALLRIWGTAPGLGRLAAVNHSIVGLRFLYTSAVFFAIGGLLAMLIRTQLATPGNDFLDPEAYGQIFTMHGTVMMFLFAIPVIEGFGLYLLPKMLGARDLAFPRLSAYGYWCYLFGGTMLVAALALKLAPDSGWFMYTPLSSGRYSPGINADVWLLGVTFVEISAITFAIEVIVTILRLRAAGMSLARMPVFAWYMLATALMMIVGFPPLILGSVLLELERAFDLPFFDPTRGGDPLLWQHLFWLFGHPEVYIIFLPAAGMVSTLIPVFARRSLVAYPLVVASVLAMAVFSFGLWVHHMFTVGIPYLGLMLFSAASMLVAVPTAIQFFAWIGTLLAGRPRLDLPMLYLFGFLVTFVAGGLTGVMVALVPFDWQAHDTHFVVAHLHYVLVGGLVFPLLAAATHWMPLVTGRRMSGPLGIVAFTLIFVGFHATFLLMHLTGLHGMPRRVFTYPDHYGWSLLNLISSIGGFVMSIGFATFLVDVVLSGRYGARCRRNPAGAPTLEWATMLPPAAYNFAAIPRIESGEPLWDRPRLGGDLAGGRGLLAAPRHGWLETLGVDRLTGAPREIVLLPAPTYVPLLAALPTGLFFLGFLLKLYLVAALGAAAAAAMLLVWAARTGSRAEYGVLPAGQGIDLPLAHELRRPPGIDGLFTLIVADAALFASLVFGFVYLRFTAMTPPPPGVAGVDGFLLATGVALALASLAAAFVARMASHRPRGAAVISTVGAVLAAAGAVAFVLVAASLPGMTLHAHGAVAAALAGYAALHLGVLALFCGHAAWRSFAGYVSPRRRADLESAAIWAGWTIATGLVAAGLLVVGGLS